MTTQNVATTDDRLRQIPPDETLGDSYDISDNVDKSDMPLYRQIRYLITDRLPSINGWFDNQFIDREISLGSPEAKKARSKILQRLVESGVLEKNSVGKFRRIEKDLDHVDWLGVNANDTLDLHWPVGADGTGFEFSRDVLIYPTDLIVLAGDGNKGKTTFAYNFMIENMDSFQVRLMGNELEPHKFAHRMKYFTWKCLLKEGGQPKFEVIRRLENHKDIILPDAINIIDWLNMDGDFWKISGIMEQIQDKLNRGVAIICLQKTEGKDLGRGGTFSKDLASVYLSISDGILKVEKVKSWRDHMPNPNGTRYRFEIVDSGSRLTNIHRVDLCHKCQGKGKDWKYNACAGCNGKGFNDVGEPYKPDLPPSAEDTQFEEMAAEFDEHEGG